MRKLTTRDDHREAQYLRDALVGGQVPATLKVEGDGAYGVWVHDDSHLELAEELLGAFTADPRDPRIAELAARASVTRRARTAQEREAQRRVERAQHEQQRLRTAPFIGTVSLGMIVLSGIVAYFTDLGEVHGDLFSFQWAAVLRGEWWRLVLPVFFHMGGMHLVFNALWVQQLGTAIEYHFRSRYLLAQVLVFGVGGVLAEGFIARGSAMGLSGVVYGLLGFLWVRSRLDPRSPIGLAQSTVIIMLVWMLLGFMDVFPMANWAHAGGLVLGMLWGAVSAGLARHRAA
ncbi:MAG: rhomboid family intramembrane serine protease [Polyangiales bacterium]|nr:rhomboid family intramembrane serine protease [Myxococcales bacterium]MCB9659486.1 rhomboid family intramembrane serine protease [Sandaracinaceae bacterium]